MKIAVIGTGYVGLVTGTCFAEAGNDVTCVDIDETKVKSMQSGKVPIYEPGIEDLFKRNTREGRLRFSTNLAEGIKGAKTIFLALPTPPEEDGSANLAYIMDVAGELGKLLREYAVIVGKSTVPVGTAEKVKAAIAKSASIRFDVVSNPEFLREGHAVEDFQNPDRIIIGSSSDEARQVMQELYGHFVGDNNPIYFMDERSAEMTKYAANAFLALKISFMNEIANVCEVVDADVDNVRLGIGSDIRIGKQFLYAGIGYGGSCFPKDVLALQHMATEHDCDFDILKAILATNSKQKQRLFDKVMNYYNGNIKDKTFALWGLAFKPDTDDVREAPALEMIKVLTAAGANVVAFDPEAMDNVRNNFSNPKLSFASNMHEAVVKADALLIATEWAEFREVDFDELKKLLKAPVVFDGRNMYIPEEMREHGFHYESIGRPKISKEGNNYD